MSEARDRPFVPASVEAPFVSPRVRAEDLPPVLVVCGRDARAQALSCAAARRVQTACVATLAEAARALETGEHLGVIVDPGDSRRGARRAIRAARAAARARPLLIVSRVPGRQLPEEARRVDATYVYGDAIAIDVELFVERAVLTQRDERTRIEAALTWLTREWRLWPSEAATLAYLSDGLGPSEIPETRGKALGTVKKQLDALYTKSGIRDATRLGRVVREHARRTFSIA